MNYFNPKILAKSITSIVVFLLFLTPNLLWSLEPVQEVATSKSQLITIDLKDTDINDVLRALGAQQGVSIVTDEALKGKVTIYLTNVPFESGLSALLNAHSLTYTKNGNIYRVTRIKTQKPYTLKIENNTAKNIDLLSLDAKDVDINEILREIALASRINIITDKTVSGNISIYLNSVPIEYGLERILKSSGFDYKKINDIYIVGKATEEKIKTIEVKDGLLFVDLKEAPILNVLHEISTQGGISIVSDSSISGMISSRLEKTPLDIGLKAILEANGFVIEKVNNIYQVSQMRDRKTFSINVDSQGLFSMDMKSAELDEVLKAISVQGSVNIITSGYVRGKINVRLTNVPLEKLLNLILEVTNFTYAKIEGVYVIGEWISLNSTSLSFINSELIKVNWLDV